VQVPSTYLWRRTVEDLHVNSIWQRLRQNLLLWLQLLVLAVLILAVLRPGIRSNQVVQDRIILLLDNSASMQAVDMGSQSRLHEAKVKALEIVQTMDRDDVAMVIAFSDRADVRQGYTSDRRRLSSAIQSIQPTNRPTDLAEALRAASGLANPGRTSQVQDVNDVQVAEAIPARLLLLTDGGFAVPPVDLGNLSAEYIPIGQPAAENVAILAFSCQRNPEKPGQVEAFARIANLSGSHASARAVLRLDDQMMDAADVSLQPGEVKGLDFELTDLQQGRLQLQLETKDHLTVDNVAYASLTPPRQLEVVLVTNGNAALAASLQTPQAKVVADARVIEPEQLASDEIKQLSASGAVDLFIYDACSPPEMPQANTLFLGNAPPGPQWQASEPTGPLFVIDMNRSHPLLQYVDLGTLLIAQGVSYQMPAGATELARTDAGVLIAVAPRGAYQDAVVGMQLLQNNTNWINRRSFPVFVLNCLEYLGGAGASAGTKSFRPGQQAIFNLASRHSEVTIEAPDGKQEKLSRDGQPQFVYSKTDQQGVYKVNDSQQGHSISMFNVNLFSERESSIGLAEEIKIGLQEVQTRSAGLQIIRAEFWRWLLLLAIVLLTLEWLVYTRRISV
jgi:Mg-chelatase subunit ChlD